MVHSLQHEAVMCSFACKAEAQRGHLGSKDVELWCGTSCCEHWGLTVFLMAGLSLYQQCTLVETIGTLTTRPEAIINGALAKQRVTPAVTVPMLDSSTTSVVSQSSRGTDTRAALGSHAALKLHPPSELLVRRSSSASIAVVTVLLRRAVTGWSWGCLQELAPGGWHLHACRLLTDMLCTNENRRVSDDSSLVDLCTALNRKARQHCGRK